MSDKKWAEYALEAVSTAAKANEYFTADDVWELIDKAAPDGIDVREMGHVLSQAVKDEVCIADGRAPHEGPGHGQVLTRWRSLILEVDVTGTDNEDNYPDQPEGSGDLPF